MKIKTVLSSQGKGKRAQYTYRYHESPAGTLSVVFPGQAYFKDAPLMWYSAMAAFEAGSDVLSLEYGFQADRSEATGSAVEESMEEISAALQDFLKEHKYRDVIFISKSIGTYIVSRLCSDSFTTVRNHIFQTPLEPTVEFMQSTENILVLVGDSDPAFGADDMDKIRDRDNIRLVIYPGANHLLEVGGNYSKSLE